MEVDVDKGMIKYARVMIVFSYIEIPKDLFRIQSNIRPVPDRAILRIQHEIEHSPPDQVCMV